MVLFLQFILTEFLLFFHLRVFFLIISPLFFLCLFHNAEGEVVPPGVYGSFLGGGHLGVHEIVITLVTPQIINPYLIIWAAAVVAQGGGFSRTIIWSNIAKSKKMIQKALLPCPSFF